MLERVNSIKLNDSELLNLLSGFIVFTESCLCEGINSISQLTFETFETTALLFLVIVVYTLY